MVSAGQGKAGGAEDWGEAGGDSRGSAQGTGGLAPGRRGRGAEGRERGGRVSRGRRQAARLAGDEALGAHSLADVGDDAEDAVGGDALGGAGDVLEGAGEEGVAGEDGDVLAVHLGEGRRGGGMCWGGSGEAG